MLLLLASLALAADPSTPPATASDKITQVPDGSVVTPPAASGVKPFTVPVYSFLLPEPMYERALTKAQQLDICQSVLEKASTTTQQWADLSGKALAACSDQFDVDAKTVEDLRTQVATLDARAYKAEVLLKDVQTQRTVAWAITGGLILGAVTVTTISLTN